MCTRGDLVIRILLIRGRKKPQLNYLDNNAIMQA